MMMGKLLLFMFVMVLGGVCGDSVHPEENNHLYDPLKPNMLQCSNTTIEGKVGDRVILPCSTKDKMDISYEEVQWTFKDPTTGEDKSVHAYFHGEDYLQEQRDDFKDRTSLFKDQLSSGSCSLSLLVTTAHSGTYNCSVAGNLPCTVTLKVLPAGGDDSSQKHQEVTVSPDKPNNEQTTTPWVVLGVGITAALLLLVIIIVAYRYREQLMNYRSGMKPKNGQVYHGVPVQAQQPPQDEEKKPLDQNPNEEQTPLEVVVHQVCLRMDPNKSQFFRYDNIILTCQDHSNATGWTVRRKTPEGGVRTCSSSWGSLSSSSSSSCTVSNIYPTDSGVYWCESTDGKTSNAVNITITDRLVLLESPGLPVLEGATVTLRCRDETNSSDLRFDFFKDGVPVSINSTGVMIIHSASKSDEGLYKCRIHEGEESLSNWLAVGASLPPPPPSEPSSSTSRLICHLVVGTPYLLSTVLLGLIYRDRKRAGRTVAERRGSTDVIMEIAV
ncbi:uncharacterized protein LOC119026834 isoform X3 [Acanthopagrus latus]|uniref:uncharacterized protein LOC119026834 isoform X3 n=1 Tax=Acanthopagrus latus TaxID=8177 RepID=UPI00187BFED4|nr:uncharacterized protein LOC119026834 isoform X3 [Acanthopagrus latus]